MFGGGIIDSMRITYQLQNTPTPVTVQHGGPGGTEMLNFAIGGNVVTFVLRNFCSRQELLRL